MASLPLDYSTPPHKPFGLAFALCAVALIIGLISFLLYMVVWTFSKETSKGRRSTRKRPVRQETPSPPASLITHGQMRLVRLDDTKPPRPTPTPTPTAKRTLADMTPDWATDNLKSDLEVVHKSQTNNKRLRPSTLHLSCNASPSTDNVSGGEKHLKLCEICQWEINNNQELFL